MPQTTLTTWLKSPVKVEKSGSTRSRGDDIDKPSSSYAKRLSPISKLRAKRKRVRYPRPEWYERVCEVVARRLEDERLERVCGTSDDSIEYPRSTSPPLSPVSPRGYEFDEDLSDTSGESDSDTEYERYSDSDADGVDEEMDGSEDERDSHNDCTDEESDDSPSEVEFERYRLRKYKQARRDRQKYLSAHDGLLDSLLPRVLGLEAHVTKRRQQIIKMKPEARSKLQSSYGDIGGRYELYCASYMESWENHSRPWFKTTKSWLDISTTDYRGRWCDGELRFDYADETYDLERFRTPESVLCMHYPYIGLCGIGLGISITFVDEFFIQVEIDKNLVYPRSYPYDLRPDTKYFVFYGVSTKYRSAGESKHRAAQAKKKQIKKIQTQTHQTQRI